MVNLIDATHAYEANLTLIAVYKDMYTKTLALTQV